MTGGALERMTEAVADQALALIVGSALTAAAGYLRWLLVRRSRKDPKDLAYYVVFGPAVIQGVVAGRLVIGEQLLWLV
jgi:hypothetical protein